MGVVIVDTESCLALRSWTGAETEFNAGFKAEDQVDVEVYSRDAAGVDTLLTLGAHYTIVLATDGTVTVIPVSLPPAPKTLVIVRDTSALQGVDFQDLVSYDPAVHTVLHSRAAMRDAEDKMHRARTLRAPLGDTLNNIPPIAARANKVLGFDAAGQPIATTGGGGPGPGGGAPTDAEYIVAATHGSLTAERVLTNTATVTWDFSTPGQVKANAAAGSGTPGGASGQIQFNNGGAFDGANGLAWSPTSKRLTFSADPVYDMAAGNVLSIGWFLPLDAVSHTIPAGKQYNHIGIRQAGGGFNQFVLGVGSIAIGAASYMEAIGATGDLSSALYCIVGAAKNNGPVTAKAGHFNAEAVGASIGVIMAVSAGVTPVATTNTGSAAVEAVLVSASGVHDVATAVRVASTGDRLRYGVGNGVSATAIGVAFFEAWMAASSSATARAFQVRSDTAGNPVLAYWHKDGTIAITPSGPTTLGLPGGGIAATVRIVGPDGGFPLAQLEGYGQQTLLRGMSANGTGVAPTAKTAGAILTLQAFGYDGGGAWLTAADARFRMSAAETFTGSTHGALMDFTMTRKGTVGLPGTPDITFHPGGGVQLGGAVASDMPVGVLSVNVGLRVANAAPLNTVLRGDGTNYVPAQGREVLGANRTINVATTGNDTTGDGSSGAPYATIQKAIDVAAALDCGIFDLTISVGNGTYTASNVPVANLKPMMGSGQFLLQGNTGSPSSVVLNATSPKIDGSDAGTVYVEGASARWRIQGFKLQSTTAGHAIVVTKRASLALVSAMDFGALPAFFSHMNVNIGGAIDILAGYTISGNCSSHYLADRVGLIQTLPVSMTINISSAITVNSFASSTHGSVLEVAGQTFSGSAVTGKRYDVQSTSVIETFTASATYFPGTIAGTQGATAYYN